MHGDNYMLTSSLDSPVAGTAHVGGSKVGEILRCNGCIAWGCSSWCCMFKSCEHSRAATQFVSSIVWCVEPSKESHDSLEPLFFRSEDGLCLFRSFDVRMTGGALWSLFSDSELISWRGTEPQSRTLTLTGVNGDDVSVAIVRSCLCKEIRFMNL